MVFDTSHNIISASHGAGRPSWWRRAAALLALLLAVWLGGFLWFAGGLADRPPAGGRPDTAVVALTGGSARLGEAMALIRRAPGARLLITGVNRHISRLNLARILPGDADLLDCCVDIDRSALDTVGNARAAAVWAAAGGYRQLTLVTAYYHMPRSLLEFRRLMPDIELRAHPVYPAGMRRSHIWLSPGTLRVLLLEYGKYQVSLLRGGPLPAPR